MTSYKDRKAVGRLAQEYGMLEEDVWHMLAFEIGATTGDVKDVKVSRRSDYLSRCRSWIFRGK